MARCRQAGSVKVGSIRREPRERPRWRVKPAAKVESIRLSGWAVLSHLNRPRPPSAHTGKQNGNRIGRLASGDKVAPTDMGRHITKPRQPAASAIGSRTAIDTVLRKIRGGILGSHSLLSGVLSHSSTACTLLQS